MISSLDPEWIFYVTGNKFIPQAKDYSVRVVHGSPLAVAGLRFSMKCMMTLLLYTIA